MTLVAQFKNIINRFNKPFDGGHNSSHYKIWTRILKLTQHSNLSLKPTSMQISKPVKKNFHDYASAQLLDLKKGIPSRKWK